MKQNREHKIFVSKITGFRGTWRILHFSYIACLMYYFQNMTNVQVNMTKKMLPTAYSFITTRLDYCNALYIGIIQTLGSPKN